MEKRVMTTGKRRKAVVAAAALLSGVLTLTACGGGGSADSDGKGGDSGDSGKQSQVDRAAAKDASDARIRISPKNGTDNAGINNDVRVTVTKGKLSDVSMTAVASGAEIPGSLSGDGKSWKPDGSLERSTKYKITATAEDSEGRKATEHSTFTTVSPDNSFLGYYTPEADSTVGVGMPVSINFDKSIQNKKAVQSAIEVNTTSGQEVVGHWFGTQRLDFRPKEYWKAGSTVTVKLGLDGVEGSPGVKGVQDKSFSFKIGRSQVSTVDVKSKTMSVVRDGKEIKNFKISAGSSENPTYNGQMVISEKFKETRMNGATVGFTDDDGKGEYDIKDVPHAMRLSTSGTFIHGNYWGADSIFGQANTSHGCVGLNDVKGADDPGQDGAWFYNQSLIGDVVTVKNSPDKEIAPDNGLNGWNMDWNEWVAGSAI
ncbi:Ig-like domain-containing protein [Streptomyces sp. WAC 00631]|uniref:L,D-transpeptidase n=1 Tax=unclassified Streptomyces TaxID=2593676 RepID=UPI000F78DFDC|nr:MULTISPECIES: Ig-like domain-containing protein [unclassified Streptomyces]MCC5035211.1 Ig-like domain-containing protein [Streptomyces sp. WAC 00631]MCC9739744.1 Ig-like domain-containing protein [Streptomyces sp. MNU89]